jgi:hypothetical protein
MTGSAIRTVDSYSEPGCAIQILIDRGTITISQGESTEEATSSLSLDAKNAGRLGKVLVALATALQTDPSGDGGDADAERSDDERSLLRAVAARTARTSGSPEWSSDQLAMFNALVSRGANLEDFKGLTPARFMQFCEAWLQKDGRISETQCVACGKAFSYERMGRPPLYCSAECRRHRNNKTQTRPAE